MHDFIETGNTTISNMAIAMLFPSIILGILALFMLFIAHSEAHMARVIATLILIALLGFNCWFISATKRHIYEGVFQVEKVNYTNQMEQKNSITIKTNDGNTQTFGYDNEDNDQTLKPGDKIKIKTHNLTSLFDNGKKPTIDGSLDNYKIDSIKKVK